MGREGGHSQNVSLPGDAFPGRMRFREAGDTVPGQPRCPGWRSRSARPARAVPGAELGGAPGLPSLRSPARIAGDATEPALGWGVAHAGSCPRCLPRPWDVPAVPRVSSCPRGTAVEARPPSSPGWGHSPVRLQPSACPVGAGSCPLGRTGVHPGSFPVPLPTKDPAVPLDEPGMQRELLPQGSEGTSPACPAAARAGLAAESFWF